MPKFCPECGKPLPYQDAEICPACGALVQSQGRPPAQPQVRPQATPAAPGAQVRNPLVALALSFLCPGWGQWYNGRRWDGLKFFGAFVVIYILVFASFIFFLGQGFLATAVSTVLGLAALGIWGYGLYDAYRTAERINRGELAFQRKSRLFWLPILLIILMIVMVLLAAVIAAFVFGMAGAGGSGGYERTRSVAATAKQVGDTIYVTWQGGQDNNLVTSYSVGIASSAGESSYTEDLPPVIGDTNQFTGGTSGEDRVLVMAFFSDGSDQVVLDTYV